MPQSDLIFDVGLHLGEDTDFYLKKGFRVVGFEAHPDFVRRCQTRFPDAVRTGALTIVSGAVAAPGDAPTVSFYANTRNPHWGTLNRDWVARNEKRGAPSTAIEVPRIDLGEYFRRYGIPHYLKIDIEGSDVAAASVLQEFEDRPTFISIETDINRLGRVFGEIEFLHSLGYRKFKPVQQQTIAGTRIASRARDKKPIEQVFEYGATGPFGDDLPGEWLDRDGCRRAYRAIFARYWAVGHFSPFFRRPRRRAAQRFLERMIGIAGWHDLHASL